MRADTPVPMLSPARMPSPAPPVRRSVVVTSLFAVVALAILLALGAWQVERLRWKEALIATLEERLAAAPVALPPARDWGKLEAGRDEYLRVAFTGQFENDKEALVYTTGSSMRSDAGGPGYWVFTPARLADGGTAIVNRGFVPDGRQDSAARRDGLVAGAIDIVGVLRWPDPPGLFTPAGEPARNIWFARDPAAIAAAKAIADAAPFYVEMESPVPPGGLPHPAAVRPSLPNNHLGYAITWFGLAAVLVGVYAAWMWGRWRGRN
jgi:surfeit locus 1 family protein